MNLLGKKKFDIRRAAFSITPAGKERLENMQGQGIELKILTVLSEKGPLTINEIDHEIGTKDAYKIEALMRSGMQMGVVSPVKGSEL